MKYLDRIKLIIDNPLLTITSQPKQSRKQQKLNDTIWLGVIPKVATSLFHLLVHIHKRSPGCCKCLKSQDFSALLDKQLLLFFGGVLEMVTTFCCVKGIVFRFFMAGSGSLDPSQTRTVKKRP
jgi:hypothetical protein